MFGGKSYPSCEVTPSLCLPRQFPFFRQRKCQGQGGQQLDWDITHSSWKCQLRKNFTFTLCPLKLLSNQKPFQCLSNVFSSGFFFTAVLSSVNCSSKTFPVLMSGAFYNVPWISRLVYPCVSLDCVSLCGLPPLQWWRLTLEFCLLEAQPLQEAAGRPGRSVGVYLRAGCHPQPQQLSW